MLKMKVLVCGLAIGSMGLTAMAQTGTGNKPAARQPGDRPARNGQNRPEQMSPEKAKAAWDMEATGVATRLGLKGDQTTSLVTAYETARTSQQAAAEKLRTEQMDKMKDMDREDRRDAMQANRKAMEDLNKSEREKFTKAVTAAIPGENGTKAATALGVFNPQWDHLVDTISGFKLDAAKQQDALNAVETFVAAQAKTMAGAGPDSDRQAMMEEMKSNREKLTASLKKDLSEDQLKKVEEATMGGRMGGRGRGPGGPGGDGGKDGDK